MMRTSNLLLVIILIASATTLLFTQTAKFQKVSQPVSGIHNIDAFNSKITLDGEDYWYSTVTFEDGRTVMIRVDKKYLEKKYLLYSNDCNDPKVMMQDSCIVTIQFNQPDLYFRLMNEENYIHSYFPTPSSRPVTQIDDTTFQVRLVQGCYHLCVQFGGPPDYIVFKDSLYFTTDTTIAVSSSEAKHRIYFEAVDENGVSLASLPGIDNRVRYSLVYVDSTGEAASSSTSTENGYIDVSDMEGHFLISSQQFHHQLGNPDIIHSVRFKPIQNVSGDTTLTNDPEDFLLQNFKFIFPEYHTDRWIIIQKTTRSSPYYGVGSSTGSGSTVDGYEWFGRLYINSEPDENYVHSVGIDARINGFWYRKEYIRISSFRVAGNQIGAFTGKHPSAVDYLSPDGGELVYGMGPIFASGLHLNNYENPCQIECYNRVYGPLNEERNYDMQRALISIYDSSGIELVTTSQEEFEPYETEGGRYRTDIRCDQLQFDGVDGCGTLRAWYDLREDDPNPPVFTSFRIIDPQGKPVYQLQSGEHYDIQFSATDFILADTVVNERVLKHLKYRSILKDFTRIWIKAHDSIEWQPLPVQEVLEESLFDRVMYPLWAKRYGLFYYPKGVLYLVDLDFLDFDNTALDIRVSVMDQSGNRSEWTLENACIIGDYDATGFVNSVNITPYKFALYKNYPNPFNLMTTISFETPKEAVVELSVYNVLGERIATLVERKLQAGVHKVTWDGSSLGSGIYFIRLIAGEYSAVNKCILLK